MGTTRYLRDLDAVKADQAISESNFTEGSNEGIRTTDDNANGTLSSMLISLKKIEFYLQVMSDVNIKDADMEE